MTIPDGLQPIAVWDARDPEWRDGIFSERFFWLTQTPISHLWRTRRIEFHLLDAPFAIVHRFAVDHANRKYLAGEEPATEEPVIVPLGQLPPAHLLAR